MYNDFNPMRTILLGEGSHEVHLLIQVELISLPFNMLSGVQEKRYFSMSRSPKSELSSIGNIEPGGGMVKRSASCVAEIQRLERNRTDRRKLMEKTRCVLRLIIGIALQCNSCRVIAFHRLLPNKCGTSVLRASNSFRCECCAPWMKPP